MVTNYCEDLFLTVILILLTLKLQLIINQFKISIPLSKTNNKINLKIMFTYSLKIKPAVAILIFHSFVASATPENFNILSFGARGDGNVIE